MPDTRRTLSDLQTLFADNSSGDISPADGRDELISAHPEKAVQSAAYASEPSSGQLTGDLFLPTDGVALGRFDGTNFNNQWGPAYPLRKPSAKSWAWDHQNSAAETDVGGALCFTRAAYGLAAH